MIGNKREYIVSALKRAQRSTYNAYNMRQKVKQGKRNKKTTFVSLLQPRPFYKVYHGHWVMVYVQLNPFQETGHKRIFNSLIRLSILKWPLSLLPKRASYKLSSASSPQKNCANLEGFLLIVECITHVTPNRKRTSCSNILAFPNLTILEIPFFLFICFFCTEKGLKS